MKYLSLFSGIGGFELGIANAYANSRMVGEGGQTDSVPGGQETLDGAGVRDSQTERNPNGTNATGPVCIGFSEIDKYATQIYQRHFPDHHNYGDITKINAEELPDFDLVVGGFPCQAFSIAGKRGGFSDTRGTLFFDIARILSAKRPRLVLLENVKGLLSHNEGRTFRTIITALDELGYDFQWQVLNAKDFGVPQNRERVFIVGHLRGTPRPQVFPLTGTDSKDIIQLNNPTHSNDRVYGAEGIGPTLNTMQGGMRQPFVAKTVRSGGRSSPHGSKQNWDSYEFDGEIRRLTPTECERLMGLPDGWTEGVSDTQRYKVCGNGVVTNVVQAVMERLLTPTPK
jgi:DNA (cytosine-5)-methyltransferase 1